MLLEKVSNAIHSIRHGYNPSHIIFYHVDKKINGTLD